MWINRLYKWISHYILARVFTENDEEMSVRSLPRDERLVTTLFPME